MYCMVLPIHTVLKAIKIMFQKVGCILLVPINAHDLQLKVLSNKLKGRSINQ